MRITITAFLSAALLFSAAGLVSAEDEASAEAARPRVECPQADAELGELAGCAGALESLVEVYRKAYEDMKAYAREQSGKVAAVFEKEKGIQGRLKENAAEITQLQFKKTRANKRRAKALKKKNKKLWKALKRTRKEREAACRSLRKAVSRKVDQVSDAVKSGYKAALKDID